MFLRLWLLLLLDSSVGCANAFRQHHLFLGKLFIDGAGLSTENGVLRSIFHNVLLRQLMNAFILWSHLLVSLFN